MDSSNGDLDQFIPADGETSKNRKVASDKKKSRQNQNELTAKCVYDDVAVAVNSEPSNCAKRLLRKRSCQILLVVMLLLVIVTVASVLVLLFGLKQGPVAANFAQSSFNVSLSNSTSSSLIPMGKGRPYWSSCEDPITGNENSQAEVHAVYTKDCELADKRCLIKQNSNGTLEIIFTPKRPVRNPIMKTRGCALFCMYRDMTQPNGCKDSNLDCPLAANKQYMYRSIEVARMPFPIITSLDVNSQVLMYDVAPDGKEEFVFCLAIPVRVVS